MNCFISKNTDIFYHLALEEFLLKQTSEDFFFLWQADDVAVVGKHQNPYKELDFSYANEHHIKIARRLSGGGTVFHDLGNINFTIIKNTEEGKQVDLKKHSQDVFKALELMGLDLSYSSRNDFLLNGQKVSGNAEHVYKNRILHHGTLLFNTDVSKLNKIINNQPEKYNDKTIASVKSTVSNISKYMHPSINIEAFKALLFQNLLLVNVENREIDEPNYTQAIELIEKKYKSEEWVFGHTPKYELFHAFEWNHKNYSVKLNVEKGIVAQIELKGFDFELGQKIKNSIKNKRHLISEIAPILLEFGFDKKWITEKFF